jgi:hypothetical protein
MGIVTRSVTRARKCYEGDRALSVKMRSLRAPRYTVVKGSVTGVVFPRPANETEMIMSLPVGEREVQLLKVNHELAVIAWDPATQCAYDRGTFVVTRVGKRVVMMQKVLRRSPLVEATLSPPEKQQAAVEEMKPVTTLTRVASTLALTTPVTPVIPMYPGTWNTRVYNRPSLPPAPTTTTTTTTTNIAPPPASSTWMRAIPTTLSGIQFRSRLEAKFARLLQLLGIRYVYEPMRHVKSGGGTYTIDFFLPEQQLYVELKPKRPHIEEEARCEEMSAQGFRVALMYGSSLYKPPFRSELWRGRSHRDYSHHDALRGMCWVDGSKLGGDTVFVVGGGECTGATRTGLEVVGEKPHLNQVVSTRDTRWSHPLVLDALQQLRDEGSSLFM